MTASQHLMSTFEDKVSALQIHTWLEIKLDTPIVVDTWLIPTRASVGESYKANFSLRANFRFLLDYLRLGHTRTLPQLQGKYLSSLQHSF